MRALIQRVAKASVTIDGEVKSAINQGLLILLGVAENDSPKEVEWLTKKIAKMRIFGDDEGLMNRSLIDVGGEAIVVSQFTLFGATAKGNRPSFIRAARPDTAIPLYEAFCAALTSELGRAVQTGVFGADMEVSLVNDGPVTIWIDTEHKE